MADPLQKLILAGLLISAFHFGWALVFRGRKDPLGYLSIGRDWGGRWHIQWRKDNDRS